MIKQATEKISRKTDLTCDEMNCCIEEIMTGLCATEDIVSFLTALSDKGETIDELTAAAKVMRSHSVKIDKLSGIVFDNCGTGGDKKGTFNISTAVSFVVAGCGVAVAKHGNRSASSMCGSADILEGLGINLNVTKQQIEKCLKEIGIAFLFAPNMHPAMKHATAARKQIGKRTIFNVLGPLCNPAGATHQLLGVFLPDMTEIMAKVLLNLGCEHALVVAGMDGLDEVSLMAETKVTELKKGSIENYMISPEGFGFKKAKLEDIIGGSVSDNVKFVLEVLNGRHGPKRNIVLLNAACGLYAADRVKSIKDGIAVAEESIDSGRALKKLALLKEYSRQD